MNKKPVKLNLYIDGELIGQTGLPYTVTQKDEYTVEVYKDGIKMYVGEFEAITIKSKWYQFWKWFN